MGREYGMTAVNFLRTLPTVLQNDPHMLALATAIAAELEQLAGETRLAQIYHRIAEMDETMLDALAEDFKVDWWRPEASVEEKRNALKASWYVHKHLGTKSAIETAVADYLTSGKVEEWFEYGGKPHHYRITGGNNDAIIENYDQFKAVLAVVTRGSAVLDQIQALLEKRLDVHVGIAVQWTKRFTVDCEAYVVHPVLTADGKTLTAGGYILTL